jgi:hypothetical protein
MASCVYGWGGLWDGDIEYIGCCEYKWDGSVDIIVGGPGEEGGGGKICVTVPGCWFGENFCWFLKFSSFKCSYICINVFFYLHNYKIFIFFSTEYGDEEEANKLNVHFVCKYRSHSVSSANYSFWVVVNIKLLFKHL